MRRASTQTILNRLLSPQTSAGLAALLLLISTATANAGLIRELWQGTVATSELPGYDVGALFRFTVLYDDSETTYVQTDVGADGIAGTADDREFLFNNTCFGGVVCYRPVAEGTYDFGSLRTDAALFAEELGDPLRTIAPGNFNYQGRIVLDPIFFGYTGNTVAYLDNALWFQAFYEGTGVRPNGIDNLISAQFTTQNRQSFEVRFSDIVLSQIPLNAVVNTGLITSNVPTPSSALLMLSAVVLLATRRSRALVAGR